MLVVVLFLVSVIAFAPAAQAATLLKVGATGSQVLTLQKNLKTLGYDPGPLDGIYGSKTKAAVLNFQQANKLQADGIYGPQTEKALVQALQNNPGNSPAADEILATAKNLIGVPYLWGGSTTKGFDCSGYTQYVYGQHGIKLPRVSRDQFAVGTAVSFSSLQPGDLVFFSLNGDGLVSHVGIYMGQNQFISATSSKGVTVYSFTPYWANTYVGAKRAL